MSAEVLRRAAVSLREKWGSKGPMAGSRRRERDFDLAVADLLDAQADAGYWEPDPDSRAALAVARLHLGETGGAS